MPNHAMHGSCPPSPFLTGRSRVRHDVVKRVFDLWFGVMILVAAAPLMLGIALLIGVSDGWPVLYRHRRIGRDGVAFDCLKFRSMARDADGILARHLAQSPEAAAEWERSRKLRCDPRVLGAVGRFLRRTSLDELPQIFNVLRGEMSLVGPRPVTFPELETYEDDRRWYLSTRPGITGPWQVSGRSDTTWSTRVALDVDYARNISLRRDLVILLRTPGALISGRGAY